MFDLTENDKQQLRLFVSTFKDTDAYRAKSWLVAQVHGATLLSLEDIREFLQAEFGGMQTANANGKSAKKRKVRWD
jgi:hypothetical protein